jgi:acyl-CoA dehydrogenase
VATVSEACARLSGSEAVAACPGGGWNTELWSALERIGAAGVGVPEARGGAGGDVGLAVAVLEVLGQFSASVPLAETTLLAGWLLGECGARVPPGPLTAAVAGRGLAAAANGDGWTVSGTLPRVAWARHAAGSPCSRTTG